MVYGNVLEGASTDLLAGPNVVLRDAIGDPLVDAEVAAESRDVYIVSDLDGRRLEIIWELKRL